MPSEAVQIIRLLLDGGYVNFDGVHFRVDAAKLWDLPTRSVPLGVAVSGRQSCERFAPLADVMIAVEPDGSLAEWWDAASDAERPTQGRPAAGLLGSGPGRVRPAGARAVPLVRRRHRRRAGAVLRGREGADHRAEGDRGLAPAWDRTLEAMAIQRMDHVGIIVALAEQLS
jgi:alkanesulfonate monooxygenase SsuD/methylene tetrahydromethanopterin reductase-like flavin-dependent oxidoreductase (luciferase family)